MIEVRRSKDRGYFDHGWLKTFHTFSFGDYHDPNHMGFRSLRVINQDSVAAGKGFGTHSHRDMEIISYVLEGELSHKDSMGNGSTIVPGDVQFMSAGSGVTHSEFNHSPDHLAHFLQIWIVPAVKGGAPCYEQRHFTQELRREKLALIASADGREGSIKIGQDANLYASILSAGKSLQFGGKPGRYVWIQIARGALTLNEIKLSEGDGASSTTDDALRLRAETDSEVLIFDLA